MSAFACSGMLAIQPLHAQTVQPTQTDRAAQEGKAEQTKKSARPAKAAAARKTGQSGKELHFGPTTGCERLPGYDAKWDSYDNDFGFLQVGNKPPPGQAEKGEEDDPIFLSGFYQMRVHGDTLYATFGGAATRGVTPGALVALDARTLAFEDLIPLPFASHAMALDEKGKKAVVTHTRANAFSLVDLTAKNVECRKPDTAIRGEAYQGRYVQMDEEGNFYINYNSFTARVSKGYVMKYTPQGDHAPGYSVRPTERADLVIPLLYRKGSLYTGTHSIWSVDSQSGAVSRLLPSFASTTFYNFVTGPGSQLVASSYSAVARPNLALVDLATGARNDLFTGSGTVEVGYSAQGGQVFSTNYDSKTVTVAALPEGGTFSADRFVNIRFEDSPSNLYVNNTPRGTDVYVTTKVWGPHNAKRGALLHKVHIAASVKGVEGIHNRGACTVITFNMIDRAVSPPVSCDLLDPKETRVAEYRLLRDESLPELEKYRSESLVLQKKARAELQAAQARAKKNPGKASDRAVAEARARLANATAWIVELKQQIPEARAGMQVLKQMVGEK